MARKWLWGSAIGAYGLGVAAWLMYSLPRSSDVLTDEQRLQRFRQLAASYDVSISKSEERMAVDEYRAAVVGKAHGAVLEVGAGTCRNLLFYSSAVHSLVLADAAPEMLAQCRSKLQHANNTAARRVHATTEVRTELAKAEALPFREGEFDCVVDTFSLCSVSDPDKALQEMRRVLRPSSDSRVLLLEHGLSPYWPVNVYLNALAKWHAQHWGCWWNRPLQDAIERADLEIIDMQRAHLGTTLVVVARPRLHRTQA